MKPIILYKPTQKISTHRQLYVIIAYAQINSAGAGAERNIAVDTELEEFIRLLKLHPELHPALRKILVPQELPHEEQETPPYKA